MDSADGSVSYRTLLADPKLQTITLASFVGTFGSYAASPALPSIVATLGVEEGRVGLVMTAYVLPAVVLLPLAGMLTDMFGRNTVLLPSLVLFGGAGSAIAFVDSFPAILALRVVQGIGGAAIIPVAITVVGDVYAGPTGSAAQGIRLSANGVSGILLPIAAGFLAGIAWMYPFLLYALAIPTAVLVYRFVPETVEGRTSVAPWREVRGYLAAVRAEARDTDMLLILWGGFFQGFSYYAILTFIPLFAVESLQASVFIAGTVLSARGVARIVLSPVSGSLLAYTSRKTALVSTLLVSALATGLMGLAPSVPVLALIVGVFGLGDALFTPIHRFSVTDLASDERRAGMVSGMVVLRQLGATISPAVFGVSLVFIGYTGIFVVAAAVYALYGAVVLLFFSPDG